MNADFAAADKNKDGRLDLAEFTVFINKMRDTEVAKGQYWNHNLDIAKMFGLHNRWSKGEGFTLEDFKASMEIWMNVWMTKRAEVPQESKPAEEVKQSSGKLVFGYWNLRGGPRGNPTRYLLNYCRVPYEEKTYVFGEDEWKNTKDSLFPLANLPYVINGETKIAETFAVQEYIAAKYMPELSGTTP